MQRRHFLALASASAFVSGLPQAVQASAAPQDVVQTWYRLVLELVRHTPTYSPPVASRAFAYLGVTAWEVTASADPAHRRSLCGKDMHLLHQPLRRDKLCPAAKIQKVVICKIKRL